MKANIIFTLFFFLPTLSHAISLASLNDLNRSLKTFQKLDVKKKPKLVVAVIDTGVELEHPDLKDHIWQNPGELGLDSKGQDKKTNGVDDDGNGFIDDIHGWNFVKSNSDLKDKNGHGTHISGIILGKSKPKASDHILPVELMVLKYFDPKMDYSKTLDYTVSAIHYAIQMGADIINYSSGGLSFSLEEMKAIQKAKEKGIVFITAAGNEGKDLDVEDYYPAKYNLENIISVSATDSNNRTIASSNYGKKSVTTKAPGKDILSTALGGSYSKMSGTSQATAFITHHVALEFLEGQ